MTAYRFNLSLSNIIVNKGGVFLQIGIPEGVVFHTLRNTFATRMEDLAIATNHINRLMGHKHNNMSLDTYSGGPTIERMAESINKLTYGEEVDSYIKDTLRERSSFL